MPRGFSGRVFHKSTLRSWDLLSPSSIWYYPVLLWGKPAKSCLHLLCEGAHFLSLASAIWHACPVPALA